MTGALLWQCQSKVHHATQAAALAEVGRLTRTYREPFEAYQCQCGEWQTGHPVGWWLTARRLAWAREGR